MDTIVIADLHLHEFKYGKLDPTTGLNTRLLDIQKTLNYIADFAINNKIKRIIIAGDIYEIKNPKNLVRRIFTQFVKKIISNSINLVVMLGNHDNTSGIATNHSLVDIDELGSILNGIFLVIDKPQIIKSGNLSLAFAPYVNRTLLKEQSFTTYMTQKIAAMRLKQTVGNKILIGHFATDQFKYDEYEETISIDFLSEQKFDLVLLGHIHHHQKLAENIYHISSVIRTDFNEENQLKYMCVIDSVSGENKFMPLPDRNFKTFNIDVTQPYDFTDILNQDLTEMITRLKVKINESDLDKINLDSLIAHMSKSWHYAGMQKEIISKKSNTNLAITDTYNPENTIRQYIIENKAVINNSQDCLMLSLNLLNEYQRSLIEV